MNLTVAKYLEGIKNKLFTPKEVILDYQKRAKSLNPELNACIRFNDEYATTHAEDFAQKPLAALPIMVKDNILIKGELATCSSKMLENYQAPYTATCMENLEKAGVLMIGQTNMDEFAMGGTLWNCGFQAELWSDFSLWGCGDGFVAGSGLNFFQNGGRCPAFASLSCRI